jgi:hypothetical protein
MNTPYFWARCEQKLDGGYYFAVCNGEEVALSGLSGNDLVNLIDAFSRMRMLSPSPVSADFYNTDAGRVTVLRSEDDGYTDAVYSIVANGRMVELTHEQFGAVIQALEEAYKAKENAHQELGAADGDKEKSVYLTVEHLGAKTAASYNKADSTPLVKLYVHGMTIPIDTQDQRKKLYRYLCNLESGETVGVAIKTPTPFTIFYNAGVFWLHNFDRAPVMFTPVELVDMRMKLGNLLNYAESVPAWYPSGRFPAPQAAHEPVAIEIAKSESGFVLEIGRLTLILPCEALTAFLESVRGFALATLPPMGTWFKTENGKIAITSGEMGIEPRYMVLCDNGNYQRLTSEELLNLEGVLSYAVQAYDLADVPSVLTTADSAAVPFVRITRSETNINHRGVVCEPPLYKLEVGELTAEPLDNISLVSFYRAAKLVLESPVPTNKMFDTSLGNALVSSFNHDKDSTVLKYAVTCDGGWEQINAVQLGELVNALGAVAWEPPTAELEAEQGEPAADNDWLTTAAPFTPSSLRWFNDQPLTITLDPLALTIDNIVAQLARLSAVAGIAWENQPQPFVAGGE